MPGGVVDDVVHGIEGEEAHDAAFVWELSGDDGAGNGACAGAEGFLALEADAGTFASGSDGGGRVSVPDTEEAALVEVAFGGCGVAKFRDEEEGVDVPFIESAGGEIEGAYVAEGAESFGVGAGCQAPLFRERGVEEAFGMQTGERVGWE